MITTAPYPHPEYHTAEHPAAGRRTWSTGLRFYVKAAGCVVTGFWRARQGRAEADWYPALSRRVANVVEACGGRLHITGLEVLDNTPGAVVFVGNHMSTLETFLIPGLLFPVKPASFVAKTSLLRYPFFGPVLAAVEPIVVTRINPREDLKAVLEQGAALIRRGRSVCLFPQTTRKPFFEAATFNSLGAKLARRAEAPLVPMAIKTDFWSTGRWIKDIGPILPERDVRIAFGPAIPAGTNPQITQAQTLEYIQDTLRGWGVECR